jgi:hypothetical protein
MESLGHLFYTVGRGLSGQRGSPHCEHHGEKRHELVLADSPLVQLYDEVSCTPCRHLPYMHQIFSLFFHQFTWKRYAVRVLCTGTPLPGHEMCDVDRVSHQLRVCDREPLHTLTGCCWY